jgi:hypothetical protein
MGQTSCSNVQDNMTKKWPTSFQSLQKKVAQQNTRASARRLNDSTLKPFGGAFFSLIYGLMSSFFSSRAMSR